MGTIGTAYGIMGICIGVLWARESDCRLEEVDTTEAMWTRKSTRKQTCHVSWWDPEHATIHIIVA